jgi:DnaJ-class molecular chaperone
MAKQNYYSVLGVPRDASAKDIKQAYRKLARKYHPDVNPGDPAAEQKFKEVSEAYAVLGNPENRKKYDHFGSQAFSGGFESAFDRDSGFGGFHTGNLRDFFNSRGGFAESVGSIFEDFFGGAQQRPHTASHRGQDREQTVEIRFEEAVRGTTISVQVPRLHGPVERLQVKIPAGVDTGSKIRLAGKGEAGKYGSPAGDLYIVTHVQPHPYFTRQGDDILCEVPVTLAEIMLGGKIEVPTIDGKTTMTIPAATQNGRLFRLRGKGIPHLKGGGQGDQYVKVQVVLPETLDESSRRLIAEFDQRNRLQPRRHMRY